MKQAVEILVLEDSTISLFEESDHRADAADNSNQYTKAYFNGDESEAISKTGIRVEKDGQTVASCIIGSVGGTTGIHPNSSLISYGGLVVCCANSVFKLSLPDLQLEWKTEVDTATCFELFYLDEDYLVHGEMEITRLNKNGQILWSQSGGDIFTTAEGDGGFVIYDDYILATDWEYNQYKFDYDGNLLEVKKVAPTELVSQYEVKESNTKKWWTFWK